MIRPVKVESKSSWKIIVKIKKMVHKKSSST